MGVHDKLIYCDQYTNALGFPDAYMVNAYSAMDCHVLVSMGEGFGIPTIEAQACGTPVITSEWTASGELCFGGWKVSKRDAIAWWNPLATYQYIPHHEAIAEKMELAYRTAGNYRKAARKGTLKYDADLVTKKYWLPRVDEIVQTL